MTCHYVGIMYNISYVFSKHSRGAPCHNLCWHNVKDFLCLHEAWAMSNIIFTPFMKNLFQLFNYNYFICFAIFAIFSEDH